MRAAVLRAFGEPLEIEEISLDPPRSGEVEVRVGAVAVCGSDVHAIDGAWGGRLPAIMGHEAAGVVTRVGAGTPSPAVGDHVVVTLLRTCRQCYYCRGGQSHLCEAEFPLGGRSPLRDAGGAVVSQGIAVGGFAEQVVVHHTQAIAIDPAIPLGVACLLACGVPTGVGAVRSTAAVPPGASVVVVGIGGVGANCLQGARLAGADPIVAVDVHPAKLAAAHRFGATHLAAVGHELRSDILAVTEGRGADFVFMATGHTGAISSGLELVRPGGTLVVVGMSENGATAHFDMSIFAASGKRIVGSRMGSTDFFRDLPAMAESYQQGALLLDELVAATYDLDGVNDAVAATRRSDTLRHVIELMEPSA